ncbi:MAG: hypothetical protein ACI9UN_003949 [Granulosicoccus sp.]|jgi:hypothetical protein
MLLDSLVTDASFDGWLICSFAEAPKTNQGYYLFLAPAHLRIRSAAILTDWLLAKFGRVPKQ